MPRILQPKTDKTGANDLAEAASTSHRLVYKRKWAEDEDISTIDDRAHSRLRDEHHSVVTNDESDDEVMDTVNDSDSDEESLHESGEGSDEDSPPESEEDTDEDSSPQSDEDSSPESEEDSPPESDEDSPPESDEDFDEDSLLESDEDSDEDFPFESDDDSEEEIPLSFGLNRREDGVTRFTSSRSRPSLMQPLNRATTQQRYQQQLARNLLQRSRHQLQQRQQEQQVIVYFYSGHNATPRGLSESEISRLPSRKYIHPDSVSSRSSGSEVPHKRTKLNKECVVCLEDYKLGDVLRTLPCCHEFHTSCVDVWLKRKPTCPVCRFIVDLDVSTAAIGNN